MWQKKIDDFQIQKSSEHGFSPLWKREVKTLLNVAFMSYVIRYLLSLFFFLSNTTGKMNGLAFPCRSHHHRHFSNSCHFHPYFLCFYFNFNYLYIFMRNREISIYTYMYYIYIYTQWNDHIKVINMSIILYTF
jgi:hypothetical protein